MIEIPIGENFEAFVNWLKTTFKVVFDLISDILNFSIDILEKTLLLEPEGLFPSVLFGLLLALVVGLLARKLLGPKFLLPGILIAALAFTALESWRIGAANDKLTPEAAAEMKSQSVELSRQLDAEAPASFDDAIDALEAVMRELATDLERDTPEYEVSEAAEEGLRDIRRTRSSDFDNVSVALDDTLAAIREQRLRLLPETRDALQQSAGRYRSLTLIEETGRLNDDLDEVIDGEELPRRKGFLNSRTYRELVELLDGSIDYFGDNDQQQLAESARQLKKTLRTLNPERLEWYAPLMTVILLAITAYLIAGVPVTIFTVVGFFLVLSMDLWVPTMESLSLVLSATLFALLIGIPLGILTARSQLADQIVRPILDFMQTMPAFVYLIPAVIFFGLGKVPGAMATLIFAMPPAVRLTSLGIRQVPSEVVEAALSFGSTDRQLLYKAQLPIAMPTILAGVNQTIMLALSMVVIGGMIGAGGLGEVVLSGITQLKLGLGFEGGIAVVILAIYLDRVTQALGTRK